MDIITAQQKNRTTNTVVKRSTVIATLLASVISMTMVFGAQAASVAYHADHADHKTHSVQRYYKPGAPVQLQSPFEYELQPNDELSLTLDLSVPASGKLDITLLTDEGSLSLLSPATFTTEANKQLQLPVTLRAGAMPGLAFLRLHIRYTSNTGSVTTRALAVAFDSRSEQAKAQLKAQLKTEGMPDVISMPATESIY